MKKLWPFAQPHPPLRLAEQLALVPPFNPWQLHVHGPEPRTWVEVPTEQRLLLGAEVKLPPLLLPQAPFASTPAEQATFDPPFVPAQLQTHEPDPLFVTCEALPELQRFEVGAE